MSTPHTDARTVPQDAPAALLPATSASTAPQVRPCPSVPAATAPVQRPYKGARLDEATVTAILADLEQDFSSREIAQRNGVSHVTVCRLAARFEDLTEGARKLLSRKAIDAIDDWATASRVAAEKGQHTPAKEWLMHAHVIDPVGDSAAGPKVQINIGVPGQPVETPIMVNQAREGGNG